jgi:hypothetical protein
MQIRNTLFTPLIICLLAALTSHPVNAQYAAFILNPSGFNHSVAFGTGGGQQVGSGSNYGGTAHALLWTGLAASAVDLTPSGFAICSAEAVGGGQQVGYAVNPSTGGYHALLWSGSAASVVDLSVPPDFNSYGYFPGYFTGFMATGVSNGKQVGVGISPWGSRALLWSGTTASVVDLSPSFLLDVYVSGIGDGQEVGYGYDNNYDSHAILWSGTAASAVILDPVGFTNCSAIGVAAGRQVGVGYSTITSTAHALLWSGTAGSAVDLNPSGFRQSVGVGIAGSLQVGWGSPSTGGEHALLWQGTAASVIDLHQFLPADYVVSQATGVDKDGNIVGWASSATGRYSAVLWKTGVSGIGLDVSDPNTNCPALVQAFTDSGYGGPYYVIAAAWGGQHIYDAQTILTGAQNNIPGGTVAAYCLLNFDNSAPNVSGLMGGYVSYQNGGWQVRQALQGVGSELGQLQFVAIDVENPHSDGIGWQNTPALGLDTVQRIGEAVQEVLLNSKEPAIYTTNHDGAPGLTSSWAEYGKNVSYFSQFPLWDKRIIITDNDPTLSDELDDSLLNDGSALWAPYGGWQYRSGRQFGTDDIAGDVSDPGPLALGADLDVFQLITFTPPPPAIDVSNQVIVTQGQLKFSRPAGGVQAGSFQIRITNPGFAPISGPLHVVLHNLSSSSITPVNFSRCSSDSPALAALGADGYSFMLYPSATVVPYSVLGPGASVAITIEFRCPKAVISSYKVNVFSGYFAPGQ